MLAGREARRTADLAADKFEPVINLKTAKALGLNIPSGVLAIEPTRSAPGAFSGAGLSRYDGLS
jgi:hypothetical protein